MAETNDAETLRPCPFCGQASGPDHTACVGLFKEVMKPPSSSRGLDALPEEVEPCKDDPTRKLNHYILVRELGRGGMGTVWKAWDRKLARWAAIKFVDAPRGDDLARFEREARLAARLRHPNIAAIYEFGEALSMAPGRPLVRYLAMEFIDGQTMAAADFPAAEWAGLFAKIARAVDAAHQEGIVHRDLKPTNFMLTPKGWPYVMDFGLAKSLLLDTSISGTGVVVGTPAFMAPEQARGQHEEVDAQSDVYSLGASLYAVLCKAQPYTGASAVDVLMQVTLREPDPPRKLNPAIPPDLERIVLKAMAKEKRDRYPDAAALADDLERFASSQPVEARLPSSITRAARRARRRAGPLAAVAVLGAAAAVGAWAAWPSPPPPPPLLTPQPPVEAARLPEPVPDPFATLGSEWSKLVALDRFASAARLLEGADGLPQGKGAEMLGQTRSACRAHLDGRLPALRQLLEGLRTERELLELDAARIDAAMRVDPAEMLAVEHPVLDWARAGAREGALAMAAAAAPLVERGENPWFLAVERVGWRALSAEAQAKSDEAQDAPREVRDRLRKEYGDLLGRWKTFLEGLPPGFRERHPALQDHDAALARPAGEFPRDLAELDGLTISACLLDPNPVARLQKTAAALEALDLPKGVSRESRRELYTRLIVARAQLALLGEASEDEAAEGLRPVAAKLKGLGGPENPGEFGPRILSVFSRLSLAP